MIKLEALPHEKDLCNFKTKYEGKENVEANQYQVTSGNKYIKILHCQNGSTPSNIDQFFSSQILSFLNLKSITFFKDKYRVLQILTA